MKRIILMAAALTLCLAGAAQPQGNIPGMGKKFVQTPDPEYVAYSWKSSSSSQEEGRSRNNSPTFFIYPDTRLDKAGAENLVKKFEMDGVRQENHANVLVINPTGENYNASDDLKAFKEMFERARSGNLKVIGIGNGATFVNTVLATSDAAWHIAGILTIAGKAGKAPAESFGVPAYVAGKNAAKVAKTYISLNKAVKTGDRYVNPEESLLTVVVDEKADITLAEAFSCAWKEVFSKNFRYNNYKHTHYEGAKYGEFGPYELEPYTEWEALGIKRKVVVTEHRNSLPWLWYEYWPEELMDGAPEKSVPVMVLLHGNANDPRTQAETSGFIQVAGKERFFTVEMEWQGSRSYGAMGHDGIEQVINSLLEKYPQLDPSRIYAEGLSAGSMTATALGIRKSYLFAAVGGHSGGIFGSSTHGSFSNLASFWSDATQKRGAVEMPYCSVVGTADTTVPFYTPDNYKDNSYLNAWNTYEQMNGLEVIKDLDFSIDSVFGFNLMDRQSIVTNKGDGIRMETGQLYKGLVPLVRIVAIIDYGHWNFMPAAQIIWDFFKQFSRDPETKKLIYHEN